MSTLPFEICEACWSEVELREDPTGMRGWAWREVDSWDDDRAFQCGIADNSLHHPENWSD